MDDKVKSLSLNGPGRLTILKESVDRWHPNGCKTEMDYENSLYRLLKNHLGEGVTITKQNGIPGIVNMVVGDVVVEMQMNFQTIFALARLLGQLHNLLAKFEKILIVLCGKKDRTLLKLLEEKLAEERRFQGREIALICK